MKRLAAIVLAGIAAATVPEYESAKRKFDAIESDKLKPGTQVKITSGELNAWVQHELPTYAPSGVRNPKIEMGNSSATGTALVNFLQVRRAQGKSPGWLMAKLLDGEHEVRVRVQMRSGGGRATVTAEQVEIGGVPIEGRMLDYLIENYLRANYPDARIGEPFELGHHIERIDVKPGAAIVVIGR